MDVLNNPVVAVLAILSSIVGIASAIIPAQTRRARAFHVVYGLAIVALAVPLTSYANQLSRIRRIERAANTLVERQQMDFTDAGFVQAALAFLEANKEVFPDAYARAVRMCEGHGGYAGLDGNDTASLNRSLNMTELAFAMKGLLRGIAAVETQDK